MIYSGAEKGMNRTAIHEIKVLKKAAAYEEIFLSGKA